MTKKKVRSTQHMISFANTNKQTKYKLFRQEYKRVAALYLDFLWVNEIKIDDIYFNVHDGDLNIPKFLSNPSLHKLMPEFTTNLSARACKCCLTQVLGAMRSGTTKQKKRIYQYTKTPTVKLLAVIDREQYTKPDLDKLEPELNSICCDYVATTGEHFTGFIQLKSIGKAYGTIKIPVNFHRMNKKYNDCKLLTSFLFQSDRINFRWESDGIVKKPSGRTVGADQGVKDILTLSDGQCTGFDLTKLLTELALKKPGGNARRKKKIQIDNEVRCQLNNIDFTDISVVKYEQVKHLRKGRRTSAVLTYWPYAQIERKVQDLAETEGFEFVLSSSAFKSQRCSGCDLVRKNNRKGQIYNCISCNLIINADLNASANHEIDLPALAFDFREKNGITDFIWNESGVYDLDGVELQSHSPKN